MDIEVLNGLLQEKGWQINQKCKDHNLFEHKSSPQLTSFILPSPSKETVPSGTFNAIMRVAHARKETRHWTLFIKEAKEVNLILEKQSDGLWGRVEMPGLIVATQGHTADYVATSLRSLLIEFALDNALSACSAIMALPFLFVYDTTAVWTLVKQVKASYIAEQMSVDMDLIGQYMTGNTYPDPEAAGRLENSIHELGRKLLQLSIR
jgi:predicted RNA binding protein YcfA (HicA-like mRNA interferase family)